MTTTHKAQLYSVTKSGELVDDEGNYLISGEPLQSRGGHARVDWVNDEFAMKCAAVDRVIEAAVDLRRFVLVQADVTDGFVHCVVCGEFTDPQVADEEDVHHHEACPVPALVEALRLAGAE